MHAFALLVTPAAVGSLSLQLVTPATPVFTPGTYHRAAAPLCQAVGDEDEQEFLNDFDQALREASGSAENRELLRIQRRSRVARSIRRRRRDDDQPLLTRESLQLFNIPCTLRRAYDNFLERPGQPLLLGSLALLVGFYLAGALSTIFGAKGFWEPTIALGPLAVGELITRRYYSLPAEERSQTIKLLNALKVGFLFGITLDALKLAG